MPKIARELSAIEIRRLTEPGFYAVGVIAGLHFNVKVTGARSWILRTMVGGRRRDIGLGAFPEISLSMAYEKARQAKEQVRQGIDPVEAKKAVMARLRESQDNAKTFDWCADHFMLTKSAELSNIKHAAQWEATLKTYASPIIGHILVSDIEIAHIMRILEPQWLTKTETMKRLRGRIENVLSWATVHGYRRGDNPARWTGNLDTILPKPGKVSKVEHHRALPWRDVPDFMVRLRTREGMGARALEFIIQTVARSGEVRFATWDEIDPDAKIWTIPAERMKAAREHRVPLTDDAIKLLNALPKFGGSNYIFTAIKGGTLSDNTISKVCRTMGVDAVPHGFRSSFRDWCAESTNYPREVAEMALAHTIGNKVEAAYRRGDLFEKRCHLMADWSRFIKQPTAPAAVTPIRKAVG